MRDISLSCCRDLACGQDHTSSVTVPLAHLPLFWYCQHSSTPVLSPALLEFPGTKSIICTVFIIPISVSAGLYIGLCPNLPIQFDEKWWMIEGSKEWRDEGQNGAKSVSKLLGQWSLNRSLLVWNSKGKNQREYITEIFWIQEVFGTRD